MPIRILQSNGQEATAKAGAPVAGCGGCGKAEDGPTPPSRWPLWALGVKSLSQGGEVGVGDTVHRLATAIGGQQFKLLMAALHVPCGCDQRREQWNKTFSYGQINLIAGKTA